MAGDVGVAVHVYRKGETYEVEFVRYDGPSSRMMTLKADQSRAAGSKDVPHLRELAVGAKVSSATIGAMALFGGSALDDRYCSGCRRFAKAGKTGLD